MKIQKNIVHNCIWLWLYIRENIERNCAIYTLIRTLFIRSIVDIPGSVQIQYVRKTFVFPVSGSMATTCEQSLKSTCFIFLVKKVSATLANSGSLFLRFFSMSSHGNQNILNCYNFHLIIKLALYLCLTAKHQKTAHKSERFRPIVGFASII